MLVLLRLLALLVRATTTLPLRLFFLRRGLLVVLLVLIMLIFVMHGKSGRVLTRIMLRLGVRLLVPAVDRALLVLLNRILVEDDATAIAGLTRGGKRLQQASAQLLAGHLDQPQ